MYLDFYDLRDSPFSPSPDPAFLFESRQHQDALAELLQGIKDRRGVLLLTGDIGTGKTTVLRALLARLTERTPVAYVRFTALGLESLLAYALEEWGHRSTASTPDQRLDEVKTVLLDHHRRGLAPLLVIDEAQHLPVEALEAVRMLSSIEENGLPLVQIVLVGQPELATQLNRPELARLAERIGARAHLVSLSPEATRRYIDHRLLVAGARDLGIFTDRAHEKIAAYSGGTPRVINAVCDYALLTGYADRKRRVTIRVIEKAIGFLEEGEWSRHGAEAFAPSPTAVWAGRATVALLMLALVAVLLFTASAMGWLDGVSWP
jgi:general secretion pathway protein A